MVGADRADEVHLGRAAHARDFRPEGFGELHRERPTPPDAPVISTFCPGRIRPWSRRPWRAVVAEIAMTAACSKLRVAGLMANLSSPAHAYSAKAPSHVPHTSSP